jgi:regulation of enolase protein 1 (concanavalin A-like superfamily)
MPFIASGSVWLRLQRRGAVFIASRSSDGHVWSVTSTSKTTLGDDLKIGLRCYFNSHGYESRQATFKVTVDQFSIQQ